MADEFDPIAERVRDLTRGTPEAEPETTPADPKARYQALVNKQKDHLTMDFEPDSTKPSNYVSVFNKVMSRDELAKFDGGKELGSIVDAERKSRRGFFEAVTDFKTTDLTGAIPGLENLDTGLGPLRMSTLRKMPDILRRLQNNDLVTDQERVYARLYQADFERKSQQGAGGIIGDFVRNTPAFGVRMWLESKAIQFGAEALVPGAGEVAMAGSLLKDAGELGEAVLAARRARLALHTFRAGSKEAELLVSANKVVEFQEARQAAALSSGNWFTRNIARANNQILGEIAGDAEFTTKGAGWFRGPYEAFKRGAGEITVQAAYRGGMYGALDESGQMLANLAAGNDVFDGRAAVEKRAAAASSGDERLGRYAEALAVGDVFRSYVTLQSGEGLSHIFLTPLGHTATKIGLNIPALKNFGKFLDNTFGGAKEMKRTIAGFEAEAEAKGMAGGGAEAFKAKHKVAFGWWLMNHMAENNVDAKSAWNTLRQMGYQNWSHMMLLSAEGRAIGGLYGADGGDYGFKQAWQNLKQRPDELFGEAVAFALPSIGVLGLSRLGASEYLGGSGSKVRRYVDNVVRYVHDNLPEGIICVTNGKEGEAIGVAASEHRAKDAPDVLVPASRNDAVDAYYNLAVADRRPTGDLSAFQRVAQGVINLLKFLVTADPSQMRTPRDMIYERGIHDDIMRVASKVREDVIDRALLEKAEGTREPSLKDFSDLDREKMGQDPKVIEQIKEALGEKLDEFKLNRGTPSITFDKLKAIATKEGASVKKVAKLLETAEKDGLIVRYSLGGSQYAYAVAYKGKSPQQATMDAVHRAAQTAAESLGLANHRRLGDTDEVRDGVRGFAMSLPADREPDDNDAHQLGSLLGKSLNSPKEIQDAIKTLRRLRDLANVSRFQTKDGALYAAIRSGDLFQIHPLNNAARIKVRAPGNEEMQSKRFSDEAGVGGHLASMGLEPSPFRPQVWITPRTVNLSRSYSRLAWEHQSTTHFSDDRMNEFRRLRKALDAKKGEKARAAIQKDLDKVEEEARKALADSGNMRGGVVRPFRSGEARELMHAVEIGGWNDDGSITVTAPSKGISEGHAVEEFLEFQRRHFGYTDEAGRPVYHPVEREFYSRIADVALQLRDEPGRSEASRKRLDALAKMYSLSEDSRFDLDPFSKAVEMIDGWHTHSTTHGGGLWSAPEFDEIRQRIGSNPDLMNSAAAFYHHAQVYVLGNYDYKAKANAAYMPPDFAAGWKNTKGVTERPLDLINKLKKVGEGALKKIMEKPEDKVVPDKKVTPAKKAAEKAAEPQVVVDTPDYYAEAELSPAQVKALEDLARDAASPIEGIDYSTVEVTPEMAGFKDGEAFRKEYEGRPEEMKDATEDEFLRAKFCVGGMDQKAAAKAAPAEKPAKSPRKPRGE